MDDQDRDQLEPDTYPPPSTPWQRVRQSEGWRSAFPHPQLGTPRGRALQSFSNFFLHVYPVKVPARVLRFRYSWRLGYILTVLFAILNLTGMYLMFFYPPSVAAAYGDMQQLRTGVGFGQLVRNVHRWSAHLMVLAVLLHLARVFFAGAYKRPRQFNWVLGVGLLVLTLAFSFTGYLLPWDQLSYWAVTVGTNLVNYVPVLGGILRDLLLGGAQIGQATLLRFYALHVFVLPAALTVLLALHIWRVRKDGFAVQQPTSGAFSEQATERPRVPAAVPAGGAGGEGQSRVRLLGVVDRQSVTAEERRPDDSVFTWPHLLVRHAVVGLATAAAVLSLGVAFAAPLRGLANPTSPPSRPRHLGTSSASRSCCRTSTRWSPASWFRSGRSWAWWCCRIWTATRPPRPGTARWPSCCSPPCSPSPPSSPSSGNSSAAPAGGSSHPGTPLS